MAHLLLLATLYTVVFNECCPKSFCEVCTVIFVPNPTTVFMLCCVVVGVVTIVQEKYLMLLSLEVMIHSVVTNSVLYPLHAHLSVPSEDPLYQALGTAKDSLSNHYYLIFFVNILKKTRKLKGL